MYIASERSGRSPRLASRRPRPIFDTPNGASLLALSLLEGENHLVGGDVAVLGFRISLATGYHILPTHMKKTARMT